MGERIAYYGLSLGGTAVVFFGADPASNGLAFVGLVMMLLGGFILGYSFGRSMRHR